jgi:hypothetical protein
VLLAQLRSAGFRVAGGADASLIVSPASRLSEERRVQVRLHKHEILRELAAEAAERHATILAASDAAGLEAWCAPLILGRLHLCGNCDRYTFGSDPADLGTCALHGEGLVALAMPFHCPDFQASGTPAAPEYLPDPDGAIARAREYAK